MSDNSLDTANIQAKERLVIGLRGKGAHLSFEDAVNGMPSALYDSKPDNVPYTFWQQIEHIRIAQRDIFKYIVDAGHVSPPWPEGYWPTPPHGIDDSTWKDSINNYRADRDDLIDLIEKDDTDVLVPVSHNAGRSIMGSVLIVIDHTSYHLGEFVMGRQILGAWHSAIE